MLFSKAFIRPSTHTSGCDLRLIIGRARSLLTLAIESSCDDTSVAILEKYKSPRRGSPRAILHFHEKITSDNNAFQGIHPIVAMDSHSKNLASLVQRSLSSLPPSDGLPSRSSITLLDGSTHRKPDFITVTRGPGMRNNLGIGLDTAKGLSVAWQIPLLGVHHMQAHALTPRLASALGTEGGNVVVRPHFPFISLLVSGGHTLLLHSKSLTDHHVLASTVDTAVGEALDKIGRVCIPQEVLKDRKDVFYAKALSDWAFPTVKSMRTYRAPVRRGDEIQKPLNQYGWAIQAPFSETRELKFSFSGLASYLSKLANRQDVDDEQRLALAKAALTTSFEHLASRTIIALDELRKKDDLNVKTLVLSGGVAANKYLRHVIRKCLNVRGYARMQLSFPPVELCTDNAAMIAWTGIEMWEAGWRTDLGALPVRKWSMESQGEGEGILGIDGWVQRTDMKKTVHKKSMVRKVFC